MSSDSHQKLANQIVDLIKSEEKRGNTPDFEKTLDNINRRLDGIESRLSSQIPTSTVDRPHPVDPSQQKFDVIEAIADQIIEDQKNEKTCTFEPNGKPCDHCSMCSSRGF